MFIRKTAVLLLGVAVASGIALAPSAQATTTHHYVRRAHHAVLTHRAPSPFIFFSPHQDDETLSASVAIANAQRSGRPTYVVFATNGAASEVRQKMCDQGVACLTPEEFTAARDREALAAVTALGVPSSHVFFESAPDGGLTVDIAAQIVQKYDALYGGTGDRTLATTSPADVHPDHEHLAAAVMGYAPAGVTHRFFVSLEDDRSKLDLVEEDRAGDLAPEVQSAAAAYRYTNISAGRYGIGYRSVPTVFDALLANLTSYATADRVYL